VREHERDLGSCQPAIHSHPDRTQTEDRLLSDDVRDRVLKIRRDPIAGYDAETRKMTREAIDPRIELREAEARGTVREGFAIGPAPRSASERLRRVHRGVCGPKLPRGQDRDSTAPDRTRGRRARIRVDTSRRPMLRFFRGGVSMAIRWPADERSRQWRADMAPVTTEPASPARVASRRCSSRRHVAPITTIRDRAFHCRDWPLYFRHSSDCSHVSRAMHAVRSIRAPGSTRKE
jgi:hypothetical protein